MKSSNQITNKPGSLGSACSHPADVSAVYAAHASGQVLLGISVNSGPQLALVCWQLDDTRGQMRGDAINEKQVKHAQSLFVASDNRSHRFERNAAANDEEATQDLQLPWNGGLAHAIFRFFEVVP